jgi:hypothetical protein
MTLDADDGQDDDLAGVTLSDDVPAAAANLPRVGKSNDCPHRIVPRRRGWRKKSFPSVGFVLIRSAHG